MILTIASILLVGLAARSLRYQNHPAGVGGNLGARGALVGL